MFVLTRRSVPHIDMGTEPPLAHIGAVNPSSDARGNFQTTFAAFRTVFNALCRETNADPGAPRVGPPHRREDLGGLSGHLDQNFRRLDRESQVRAGLPAGGRGIRTPGPALRKALPGVVEGKCRTISWAAPLSADPVARRRYRRRFPTAIFHDGTEGSNPLCSSSIGTHLFGGFSTSNQGCNPRRSGVPVRR